MNKIKTKIEERIKSELPISRRRYFEIVFDEIGLDNSVVDEIFGDEDLDDIIYDVDANGDYKTFIPQLMMFIDCFGDMEVKDLEDLYFMRRDKMKILIIIGLIVFIIFVWALVLALCTAGADETGRSILYDNPEYFKHDEPEWLRREDEE